MKMRSRFLWRVILIFFLSVSLHSQSWSQPGQDQDNDQSGIDGESTTDDGGPGGPGDPVTDPDLPIDSNIFILVAAGVGYGLKKIYDSKRKKSMSQQSIII